MSQAAVGIDLTEAERRDPLVTALRGRGGGLCPLDDPPLGRLSAWISPVEHFFTLPTDKQIRRGVHRSTEALERDTSAFLDAHNADPKPFRWTKTTDDILAAIQRFCPRPIQAGETGESGR